MAILAAAMVMSAAIFGWFVEKAAVRVKEYERSVTVKGLAEREVPADVAICPISFTRADNEITTLYASMDRDSHLIIEFLRQFGIKDEEISVSTPQVTDKLAQQYGGNQTVEFRYTGMETVTVYSSAIDSVRSLTARLKELGKTGITITDNRFQGGGTRYLFENLNSIKPEMVEDATQNAREVAEKFAHDSHSRLGKIRHASQGQFSISSRDNNNPQIKKVRVVSTISYYLSD